MNDTQNPLLTPTTLPHGAYPFDQISDEHYLPAFEHALEVSRSNIEAIRSDAAAPDFENTVVALESADDLLDWVSSGYYDMKITIGTELMHELDQTISPMLAAYRNDLALDEALFARVKVLYDQQDQLDLNTEQHQVLTKLYKFFARNGALLDETGKKRLREIDEALSKLSPQYQQHVLKEMNGYELHVTEEADLAGLPESSLDMAKTVAEEKKKAGWIFTLQMPSYYPFMQYADNRNLREQIWRAFSGRCVGGENDNSEVIRQMVQLRHERAQLLGYPSHAAYTLEERMAGTPQTVYAFYDRLIEVVRPAAEKDFAAVRALKAELSGNADFQPWDFSYYSEKLKQRTFDFDTEALRPYFKLENVVEGVFEHARRLYKLEFVETNAVPKYHPEVTTYEVRDRDSGDFIGLFYTDFFPRDTKQNGAWMSPLKEQGLRDGQVQRPHIMNVCNFTKPAAGKPSLLSLDEVLTLFHEFGHALHGLLSDCTYRSIAGTNVYWDFVELPSQIMENWLMEIEALNLFARHYETGEVMPPELIDKLRASARFNAGIINLRQIFLGKLDLSYHDGDPSGIDDIAAHEWAATQGTHLFDLVPGTAVSHSFLHIFAGGYSAGYYSYKWAEVLDADAFEMFKEEGIFNPETAARFREHILSRGGSENPMELYKRFRGREPDPEALLRRDGLIPA
ncbi:MAG: peptidyl-dipeptidase Dcp [Verrucomicrobiales bacterium]|jgi:peptidyl-dipeptidase Dcp